MAWGRGDADAEARIKTITAEELLASGITPEIADEWYEFYREVVRLNPTNPSARGRSRLMEHARELLKGPAQS